MFMTAKTSDRTIALYHADARAFVAQYCREQEPDACDMTHETRVVLAVEWFLGSGGRWSKPHIRRLALALSEQLKILICQDMVDSGERLLSALKHSRPAPVAGKSRGRKKYRKSCRPAELRALIDYFRNKSNRFSRWIAGYIQLSSRIGWRPGEMVALRREGKFLRAPAEKCTNERGLTDVCEIDISAYPARLIVELDQWIAQIDYWAKRYDGLWNLRAIINGRLATACAGLGIQRVATYTFRHFAVSSMKKSGFSQSEIAVIINHATNRTAGEHYGRRSVGIRRPKKMLGYRPERLLLTRDKARRFEPGNTPDFPPS